MSDKYTPEGLRKIFYLIIGDDSDDKIELKHLKRVASDDELAEMIVRPDADKDGKFLLMNSMLLWTKKYI